MAPPSPAASSSAASSAAVSASGFQEILSPFALSTMLWQAEDPARFDLIIELLSNRFDQLVHEEAFEETLLLAAALIQRNRAETPAARSDRSRANGLFQLIERSENFPPRLRSDYDCLVAQLSGGGASSLELSFLKQKRAGDYVPLAALLLTSLNEKTNLIPSDLAIDKLQQLFIYIEKQPVELLQSSPPFRIGTLLVIGKLISRLRERNAPPFVIGASSDLDVCIRVLRFGQDFLGPGVQEKMAEHLEELRVCKEIAVRFDQLQLDPMLIHLQTSYEVLITSLIETDQIQLARKVLDSYMQMHPKKNHHFYEMILCYAFLLTQVQPINVSAAKQWLQQEQHHPLYGGAYETLLQQIEQNNIDPHYLWRHPRTNVSQNTITVLAGQLGTMLWNTKNAPLAEELLLYAIANTRSPAETSQWSHVLAHIQRAAENPD